MFDECFEYDDHLGANGHFGIGEALQPAETALFLYWKNGKSRDDGRPFTEIKEQLGEIGVLESTGYESRRAALVATSGPEVWDEVRDTSNF